MESHIGKLIIARHHESEWNKKGVWTGSRNVHLTDYGFVMSEEMGKAISDIQIDQAFTSAQIRSFETLLGIEDAIHKLYVPVQQSSALNERDYGEYTGKNKWDMEQIIGEEEFNKLRREWDYPVPHGETLKMVYERIVPYFIDTILPVLREGKNVLVVSHGNAIRALIKYIEKIPDENMKDIEMLFGHILIYNLDNDGHTIHKEIRKIHSIVNA